MSYTVNKLSELSGVSIRTLHYYDEIDLLKPSYKANNGYRYYEEDELLKLQQILFYRELDFALEDIKRIVNAPNFNILQALEDHKKFLNIKIKRTQNILNTINKTIKKIKGEKEMEDKELYGDFTKKEMEKYREESKLKYGDNDKTKNWSREKLNSVLEEGKKINSQLVEKMEKKLKPEDKEVQIEIAKHFEYIQQFWDCNYEAFKSLGRLYIEDKRFTKNIDKSKEGLAQFMCNAMEYFSDQNGIS